MVFVDLNWQSKSNLFLDKIPMKEF